MWENNRFACLPIIRQFGTCHRQSCFNGILAVFASIGLSDVIYSFKNDKKLAYF